MCKEIWRPVVGYEGLYEVSDRGQVKSLPRPSTSGRMIKQFPNKGYPTVTLSKQGKVKTRYVHQLVLEAFVGGCPSGHEVAHEDGNPANAHLVNLSYKTKAENAQDSLRHGTNRNAKKTECSHCGGSYLVNGRGQRYCPVRSRERKRESYRRNAEIIAQRQKDRRQADPEYFRAIERKSKQRSREQT